MRVIKIPGPEEKLGFYSRCRVNSRVSNWGTGGRGPFSHPCSQGTWCPTLVGISIFELALNQGQGRGTQLKR